MSGFSSFALCLVILGLVFVPLAVAQAQGPIINPNIFCARNPTLFPTGYWGPLLSCSWAPGSCLPPCTSVCDAFKTVQNIIYFGMTILLFILTPVFLLVGGVMIMISAGKQSMISRGRGMITGAVIGVAIGLGAFVIVNTFLYALNIVRDPTGQRGIAWPKIECRVAAATQPVFGTQPTHQNCTNTSCPSGSQCLQITGNRSACSATGCTPRCPSGTQCVDLGVPTCEQVTRRTNTCTPACAQNETCDVSRDPPRCVTLPTPNQACDPFNPNSCPRGQSCVLNTQTGRLSCQRN